MTYDAVTAQDITDFLHHLATLRVPGCGDDPAERAAFYARKAELFTRIADEYASTDPAYSEQVRQMATEARTAAADETEHRLPQQRVGPHQRRTTNPQPEPGGARSQ